MTSLLATGVGAVASICSITSFAPQLVKIVRERDAKSVSLRMYVVTVLGFTCWSIYGVLRTADAMTPFLTAGEATVSLIVFCLVYVFIFSFGTLYIDRLLQAGPVGDLVTPPATAVPNRPMSVVDKHPTPNLGHLVAGE